MTPQQALGVLHHAGPPEVDDPGEHEHAFVVSLVRGAMDDRDALDERIGDAAKNWRVERMAILDRLVMRLARRGTDRASRKPAARRHQRSDRAGARL